MCVCTPTVCKYCCTTYRINDILFNFFWTHYFQESEFSEPLESYNKHAQSDKNTCVIVGFVGTNTGVPLGFGVPFVVTKKS